MFTNITWKKLLITIAVLLSMTGVGFAVKYAEDGQVGTTNVVSTWLFIMTGLGAVYALAVLAVLLRRALSRSQSPRE